MDYSEFTFDGDTRYGSTWAGELLKESYKLNDMNDVNAEGVIELMQLILDTPKICLKIIDTPLELLAKVATIIADPKLSQLNSEMTVEEASNLIQGQVRQTDLLVSESKGKPLEENNTVDEKVTINVVDKSKDRVVEQEYDAITISSNEECKKNTTNVENNQIKVQDSYVDSLTILNNEIKVLDAYENTIRPLQNIGLAYGKFFTLWFYRFLVDGREGLEFDGCCKCTHKYTKPGDWLRTAPEAHYEQREWLRSLHTVCAAVTQSECASCIGRWLATALYGCTGKLNIHKPGHYVTIVMSMASNDLELVTVRSENSLTSQQTALWLLMLGISKEMAQLPVEFGLEQMTSGMVKTIGYRLKWMVSTTFAEGCPVGLSKVSIMLKEPFIALIAYEATIEILDGSCKGICDCASEIAGNAIAESMTKKGVHEWINEYPEIFSEYGECAVSISHVQNEGILREAGVSIGRFLSKVAAHEKPVWLDICQRQEFNPHLCRQEYLGVTAIVSKNVLEQSSPYTCLTGLLLSKWMSRGWTFQEAALPRVLLAFTLTAGVIRLRVSGSWCIASGRLTELLDEVMPWEQEWSPVVLAGLQRRAWRYEEDLYKVISLSLGKHVGNLLDLCKLVAPGHVAAMAVAWQPILGEVDNGTYWMPYNPPAGMPMRTKLQVANFEIRSEGLYSVALIGGKTADAAINMIDGVSQALVGITVDLIFTSDDGKFGILPVTITGMIDGVLTLHKDEAGKIVDKLPIYQSMCQAEVLLG